MCNFYVKPISYYKFADQFFVYPLIVMNTHLNMDMCKFESSQR